MRIFSVEFLSFSKPNVMGLLLSSAGPPCLGNVVWGLLFSVLVVSFTLADSLWVSFVLNHVCALSTVFDVTSSL